MGWHDLWLAVGLLLVMEGLMPFASPGSLRRALVAISAMSDSQIRFMGLGSMLAGLLVLAFLR